MAIENEQVPMRQIAYWQDGYYIEEDNAAELAEIFDEFKTFGDEPHTLLDVPKSARLIQTKALVLMDIRRLSEEKHDS